MSEVVKTEIDSFNELSDGEARTLLHSCLAVPRWIDEVMAGRPFATLEGLLQRGDAAAARLTRAEVDAALARHPRIGERAGAGHDVELSKAEQSGVDSSDAAVTAALLAGNVRYEELFGRVFLIRAAGRSSEEILSELNRRLDNGADDELAEVVVQLGEIANLRLQQLVTAGRTLA